MIQFDKLIHPVVLYENDLICIFMNINENFSNERKNLRKFKGCTYKMIIVSPTMCSSVSVNSYIFPLGTTVMHRLKLSIMFATQGQLAAKILVIFEVNPIHFFGDFFLYSNVYINFYEYVNKTSGKYYL